MTELLQAAKAVIEDLGFLSDASIDGLRAAVERAENPPAYFMEWWETFPLKTDDVVPAVHAWEAGFTAAQQAERERAEKQEVVGFEAWYQRTMDDDAASLKAKDCWIAAQQFEQERVKEILKGMIRTGDPCPWINPYQLLERIDATTE